MQPPEKVTITETEIKLQDTAIQFQLAITNAGNEDVFRSCINSFISAARSITMVMEKESSKNTELLEWYKSKTEKFATIPLMRFFNSQRVHTIHRGNVKPKSQSMPVRNIEGEPGPDDSMMSIWVFDNIAEFLPDETGNVFRLCDEYLQTLAVMVQEWRYLKDVFENPRDVIDELQADRRRMRGQIHLMRSELQQAKLTLETLNAAAKARGYDAEDSFVNSLVNRIDRLLDREKFDKANAAKPQKGTTIINESGQLKLYTILISPTEAGDDTEGVYATIRNDYAKDENGEPIFNKEWGFWMWGSRLKGQLPPITQGFTSQKEAEEAAFRIYKMLRY
jgi:hypothetical protein